MKIRELSITNCLSFSEKGLNENGSVELGDFNLFIGSNNAGKSNVLKLTEIVKAILHSTYTYANEQLENFPLFTETELGDFQDWVSMYKYPALSLGLHIWTIVAFPYLCPGHILVIDRQLLN